MIGRPPRCTLFPARRLSRSTMAADAFGPAVPAPPAVPLLPTSPMPVPPPPPPPAVPPRPGLRVPLLMTVRFEPEIRSEEHTSQLQSPDHLLSRPPLDKKKKP